MDTEFELVAEIRRKLEARTINVRWPTSEAFSSPSQRKSNRKGAGFEFAGKKIYDPADGDDARKIDWNASAAEPDDQTFIVNTYKRPRVIRLSVLLSVARSMNMGSKGIPKSILAATMAGCGIESAKRVRDRASFVTYTDQPVTILKSRPAANLLTPSLIHSVRDRNFHDPSDPREGPKGGGLALSLAATHQKAQSLVMVVSDFANMNENDWEALSYCGMRDELICVFVQDKRERELPEVPWPGAFYNLEDLHGDSLSIWVAAEKCPHWLLTVSQKLFGSNTTASQYAANFKRHEDEILERLGECGAHTIIARTDEEDEAVQTVLATLANKLRQ